MLGERDADMADTSLILTVFRLSAPVLAAEALKMIFHYKRSQKRLNIALRDEKSADEGKAHV